MDLKLFFRKNWAVVLFFIFLAIFRLSLTTQGHRFDLDERRYFWAIFFWNDILHGRFFDAVSCFFSVSARPGFILFSLIPSGLQILLVHLNLISTADMRFFDIPSIFNVFITLINSFLFYRILILVVSNRGLAFVGVVIYSLLVNTNVYIRHLFPYDCSLLLFFIAIYLILKHQSRGLLDNRFAVMAGLLCALGSLTYPGYYALALVVAIFLASSFRSNPKVLLVYAINFLSTILFFEILARLVGKSYLLDCSILSSTVNHGSFTEGFLFITRYLKDVEGLIGVVLLTLFMIYSICFLPKDHSSAKWLVLAAILMYSLHAILGLVFFKMVFYGRTLHLYFPFMIFALVRVLTFIPLQRWRSWAAGVLLACSIISFIPFAYTYGQLSYPHDIFFKYLSRIPEDKILWIESDKKVDPAIYKNYAAVAVNLKAYFGVKETYVSTVRPSNMVLVVDKPHPLNFPSYTFENYTPEERKLLKERKYRMMIFVNPQKMKEYESIRSDNSQSTLGVFLNKVLQNW